MSRIGSTGKLKNQYTAVIIIFYAVFSVLMIFGTFRDLQIDKAVFNYGSRFGMLMQRWGVIASYIAELGSFSAVIACMHGSKELEEIIITVFPFLKKFSLTRAGEKIFFIFHKVVYAAFIFGLYNASKVSINYVFKRIFGDSPSDYFSAKGTDTILFNVIYNICIAVLAVLSAVLFRYIRKRLNGNQLRLMESMAGITLLMLVVASSVDVIKDIFTRVRFREMIAYSHGLVNENGMSDISDSFIPKEWIKDTDFSAFDFWFRKGNDMGIYSDADSFPSGHTANASYSMLLIPLFYKGGNVSSFYEKFFIPASVIGIGYVAAMGISRLIVGAHYLTDVCAGAAIMFTGMILCTLVIGKFEDIYDRNLNR